MSFILDCLPVFFCFFQCSAMIKAKLHGAGSKVVMTWSLNSRSNRAPCFSPHCARHCIFFTQRTQAGYWRESSSQLLQHISLVSAFHSWHFLSGSFQWDQSQNCYRREKDLGVSLRQSLQQKMSQRAQVAYLHKESKRFSILLLKDSELHTSWKETKPENQIHAGEKPMPFAVQLWWLSIDFLEMKSSTFLDLWTLTHFQQEAQILSIAF